MRALLRNKGRSLLTAFSVSLGVAVVVWVSAIGRAGTAKAEEQLHKLGDNLVWVEAGSRNVNGVRTGARGTTTLTPADAKAILDEVPLVKSVSPQVDATLLAVAGSRNWTTRYRGVAPAYLDVRRWEIASGAPFTDADVEAAANVCVLGETARRELFGDADPVGARVLIGALPFEVVGVLAPKGQSLTGRDQDDTIFVPYTTALKKLRGRGVTWVDDIMCSAVSPEAAKPAAAAIVALLRQRHHVAGEDDDFNIRRPEELINAQIEASRTFERLLVSIAAIALLVGGIGIMNVMLASVTERTREIGVRLAVGATARGVQAQFLAEAVVLSAVGGILGIGCSVAGTSLLGPLLGWALSIPPDAVALALLFSLAVGVFFGFYPARRAARLDPIAALRRE